MNTQLDHVAKWAYSSKSGYSRQLPLKLAVFFAIGIIVVAALTFSDQADYLLECLSLTALGHAGLLFGRIFLGATLLMMGWRILLFLRYRPLPSCPDNSLPVCTIVVPAYNEGKQVLLTLRSLAESNYPSTKLQIIAVDDGSVDDTWFWICTAATELGDKLTTIRLPLNGGKRHALYEGFQRSRGEVLVTVDSDSVVEADTLRNLVGPFAEDKRIGAMAGNVRVLNSNEGVIPRMLDVIFLFSFDFIRAGQSMVKTVMCTPGALSAYRADVVKNVLPQWLDQKFCGKPANIGEDRAMTNLILKNGYHVLFQSNSMVYTNVPVTYRNLCKMFLRWARSNVRESLMMSRFIFTKFRLDSMLGARINLVYHLVSMIRAPFILLSTLAVICWHPVIFSSIILLGAIISSSISVLLYAWRYRTTDAVWGYLYGFFWIIALSWITPFALITPHKSGWLTRNVDSAVKSPEA